jgi:hypothetical protein
VEVAEGIGVDLVGSTLSFVGCMNPIQSTSKKKKAKNVTPTDDTLPEIVALGLGSTGTRELPVYLVLDITHSDKSSNDTSPAARLD